MSKYSKHIDLDAINADLCGIASRLRGLACTMSFVRLDDRHTLEDAENSLLGLGEVLKEECDRMDRFRPLISECALRLSQR
jgi:hypothetical protein